MTDLTTSLILSLKNDQFNRELRQSGNGVERFAGKSTRELRGLRHQFKQLTGGVLGKFRNELVAIGTAWAGLSIAKNSALLDKNLTRMSQTAGVARTETKALRGELYSLQKQYGVLVDTSRSANDNLLQSGLNWAEALKSTQAIAPASAITGANPDVLASGLTVGAKIFGYDLAQIGVATDLLDKFTVAGRAGNAELEDLSSIFARVGPNAKTANMSIDQTLGFIEQLSLIEKQPERLATLADSTLRIFTNQKYQQKVTERLGVGFYGKDGSRRDTFSVINDISTLFKKQKTDLQRDQLIAAAFGETDLDTQRGIKSLLAGDAVVGMREITEQTRNASGTLERDLKDALDNAVDQTARLKGALGEAADGFAQPINNAVSRLIKYALDSKKDGGLGLDGTDLLLGGAGVLAGGAAAYKYGGPGIRKLLGKGGQLAGGVAAGKALEAAAGVTPVYVVNMPSGFGGGGSVVDDVLDLGRKGRRGGMRGGRLPRLPRLPGPGNYNALPGSNPLKGFGIRNVLNDYAAHGLGRLLGGIGLNASVLGGSVGAASLGATTAGVGIAGAAGYGVGTLATEGFKYSDRNFGTHIQSALADTVGKAIAETLAVFGNKNAQETLALADRAQASLKIELDDKRAKISQIQSRGMDVDISGSSMVMP